MKLESISQEPAIATDGSLTDGTVTIATISQVPSSCILARQAIEVLGRPGKDSDMEMMGGDGIWTIVWSKPQLTLEDATHLLEQAIARGSASTTFSTQPQVDLLATEEH